MVEALGIPKEKVQVFIHLYSDMSIDAEIDFWSKELGMPKNQFSKPYIKESKRADLDHKGFGHGTCGLRVSDTVLKERILMGIKAITDFSEDKIREL